MQEYIIFYLGSNILSPNQFEYMKYKNTTHAVLKFVHDNLDSFSNMQYSAIHAIVYNFLLDSNILSSNQFGCMNKNTAHVVLKFCKIIWIHFLLSNIGVQFLLITVSL